MLTTYLLTLPKVQSSLSQKIFNSLNDKYNTHIVVDSMDLSNLKDAKLYGVLIKDEHEDTIIYAREVYTAVYNVRRIYRNKVKLGSTVLKDPVFKLITYEGDSISAFDRFVESLSGSEEDTKSPEFRMTVQDLRMDNGRFYLYDYNTQPDVIESFTSINSDLDKLTIKGSDVSTQIKSLALVDKRGLVVENMTSDFSYAETAMRFEDMSIHTPESEINGSIAMTYKEGDLSDFLNKVTIDARLKKTRLASTDLRKFYDGFGRQSVLYLNTGMKGTLNDFTLNRLSLSTDSGSKLKGQYRIVNALSDDAFVLDAKITQLESQVDHLKRLMPVMVNEFLPETIEKFGRFSLTGDTKLTGNNLYADVNAQTEIGALKTKVTVKNYSNTKRALYEGQLQAIDLNLGTLLDNPNMGVINATVALKGKGFIFESINAQIDGTIETIELNNYNYSGIVLNGGLDKEEFSGLLTIDDPNLKMNFEGLADMSKEQYDFDFKTTIKRAELNKLHWFERDSLSVLAGSIKVDMTGNALENMQGTISFENATYTNQIKDYFFKDFRVTSDVKDSIQTLKINSKDIVKGYFKGRFLYQELGKLAQNALGSIYTNYQPLPVSEGQFIDFKFNIYNQAVAVFFPEVTLGDNTFIKGAIDSDKDLFKLNFRSPEALAFENYLSKINLQIDNKNPLFNTQLSLDELNTSAYNVKDLYLVNVTLNDTLFFRTEFKGGEQARDQFNLSFYHTLDENNQSIVGFQNSDITFNDTTWQINPDEENPNKIVYNSQTKAIDFQNLLLNSDGQTLTFFGSQQGEDYRDYNIDFDRVLLSEILPDIDDFDLDGLINGGIWIEKRNGMLIPKIDVQVVDFTVNNALQGDLVGEIKGGDSNKEYDINIYMEKDAQKSMTTVGKIDFTSSEPTAHLTLNLKDFDIAPMNAIGQGVMENIRGRLSGEAGINGALSNPELSGTLTLENGGIFFPFIHVDYGLKDNALIRLDNQSFVIPSMPIFDTLYGTEGVLSGRINHHKFKKWNLDLKLETDNLLVLNKPESLSELFYGTAYLNGFGFFKGDTDNINISVVGSSNVGTEIIIPMSDESNVSSSRLIHFKNPDANETDRITALRRQFSENFRGLSMDLDLDINKNALIKFVIDQTTGSFIEGSGSGNILMDIDTRGSFNMYGDYVVDQGVYNFKYGALINKPFAVKEGSSIAFVGDPLKAELDIEALYTVKANPKVILPDYESNRNVPVQLTTKITGELFNSTQEFDISIPNAGVDLESELDFALNNQDTGNLMRQVVSLLTLNSFLNVNDVNSITSNALAYGSLTSSFATMVSNALMDVFSDPDDIIQLGLDYNQGNQSIDDLYTDDQLGLTISGRLGKNKNFVFNGEVLVPTGRQTNSNIAGNFSLKFPPLNTKETLFLRVFNRQNEIQYSEEEEGYTQGLGLSWQIDFDNKEEFFEKLGFRRKKKSL